MSSSGVRGLLAAAALGGLLCTACATGALARKVSPGILAGRHPEGQADFDTLRARGVRTIVSLGALPWNVARERRQAHRNGFIFRNFDVIASPFEPSERSIEGALLALHDPTLRPVFVHCHLGRDRAPMVVGLYRIYYEGWTPEAAWDEMLRTGFKLSWMLSGLRRYFWSHTRRPDWVKLPAAGSGGRFVSGAIERAGPFTSRRTARSARSPPSRPYVDYLRSGTTAPVEYVLGLFEHHDLVILCERAHPEATQDELIGKIVADPRFTARVHLLFTELGGRSLQDDLDRLFALPGRPPSGAARVVGEAPRCTERRRCRPGALRRRSPGSPPPAYGISNRSTSAG